MIRLCQGAVALWLSLGPLGPHLQAQAPPDRGRSSAPLRVHLICQQVGRTKACPALLRPLIDALPVTRYAPRATAEVILVFNALAQGNLDLIDLRLLLRAADLQRRVGEERRVHLSLSTRISDDAQRQALSRALSRALLPLVEARSPDLVDVRFRPPEQPTRTTSRNLHLGAWVGGNYDWTPNFQSGNGWTGVSVSQVARRQRWKLDLEGNYAFSRQPPLTLDDGTKVNVNTSSHGAVYKFLVAQALTPHITYGMLLRGGTQDRRRLYRFGSRNHVGLSWDLFAADDPRGNALTFAYLAGFQADLYHERNVLLERMASFVSHGLIAAGSMRLGTTTLSLTGRLFSHLTRPDLRHEASLQPAISVQAGAYVDVELAVVITKQAFPGRLETDAADLSVVQGQSYAEPLRIRPQFNLVVHWDRTNVARNTRWEFASATGQLDNL